MSDSANNTLDKPDQPESENKELTHKSFAKELLREMFREKFTANWKLFKTYLRTTWYVLWKPAILVDDVEDKGMFNYIQYSMATFSVTALVIVIFSFLGVESHSSEKKIFVDEECDDCQTFAHWQVQDSLYVGELKNGRPHGTGVLFLNGDESLGEQDSVIVSGFVEGYLVGRGFKFGDLNRTQSIVQLFDGIKDDGFHKYKPFLALLYYALGLSLYLGFVRYFKKAYRELPPNYLARGAVFHFNAMFFLFVVYMMFLSWIEAPDVAFGIMFLFAFHPLYFFYKIGKVRVFTFRYWILGLYSGSVLLGTIIVIAGIMFGAAVTEAFSEFLYE